MRLGVNARDLGKMTAKKMARTVSNMGFDSIQIALYDTISDLGIGKERLSPGLANYIGDTFHRKDVQIAALECFINPVLLDKKERKEQIDILKEHIRYARDFGCSIVTTETGSLNADFSFNKENHSEHTFEILLKSLNEMVEEAEKFGVLLCVEGCSALVAHNPDKIKRMLDKIDSNNLQVLFDPVDLLSIDNYKNQDNIIRTAFELFGDRINLFHAKDFLVEDGKFNNMVQAGKGMLNYELVFQLLKAHKPYIDIIMEDVVFSMIDEGINYLRSMYKQ